MNPHALIFQRFLNMAMKSYLLFLSLAAAGCSSPSAEADQTQAATGPAAGSVVVTPMIDEKNGFRELSFGQDRASIPDLVELPGRENVTLKDYQKKPEKEKLQVGTAEVQAITYGFHNDKLARVTLTVLGDNTDKLLNAAKGLYGEPVLDKRPGLPGRWYWWIGEKVVGSYHENGKEGKRGYLTLSDKVATADVVKPLANEGGAADL
ncbi:hypothetical protein [Hymenobacter guriensis]|uniref:Uncharacterized protein n=1 Tax=Hymenobacter guriensis TaxID=2793065 RepID=A0ABS0L6F1_9BACT|nr:hypothetical protein [Hymenobacter guriensis]MBG8555103.1 hypothetical protein [Hymenobacter guriensis]